MSNKTITGLYVLGGLISCVGLFYAIFFLHHLGSQEGYIDAWWILPTQIVCGFGSLFGGVFFKVSMDELVRL